ncbi:MAG: hypothetical protein IJ849_08130 [Selenomonadaceae bacterium]|nr:hypothetical protein [Selenomonadaceae bacterium]
MFNEEKKDELPTTSMSQKEIFHRMSEMLDDEERADFGRFMDAEEARKVAMYG